MSDINDIQISYSDAMRQADRLREVASDLHRQERQLQEVVAELSSGGWTGLASKDFCHRILDKAEQIAVSAFNAEVYAEGIEDTARLMKQAFDAQAEA